MIACTIHTLRRTQQQPLTKLIVRLPVLGKLLAMSSRPMNRETLLTEIIALGELPPKTWTNAELQIRLEELRNQHGLPPLGKAKERTPLREIMIRLNKASVKKDLLIQFVRDEMRVPITGNELMNELKKKGILAAYNLAETSEEDPVGFGEHASLTYREIQQTQPRYCEWVMKTFQEGSVDPRLARLAKWLQKVPDAKMQPDVTPYPITLEELKEEGYLRKTKAEAKPKSMAAPSRSSGRSSSSSQIQVLEHLVETVKELAEEVKSLKTPEKERPRKKTTTKSDDSFQVLDDP